MEQFVPGSLGGSVKQTRGAAAVGRGTAVARQHMTKEEKHAAKLKSVSDLGYGAWTGEMGAGIASLAGIGFARMGWKSGGAALKMVKAPFRALTRVSFSNIGAFRAETLRSAADVSQITGGKAHGWVAGLSSASAKALEQDRALAGRIAGFFAPLGRILGSLFAMPALRFLQRPLEMLRGWRVNANSKKSIASMEGLFKTITDRGEKATGAASLLSTAESLGRSAEGLSGQARVDALRSASEHMIDAVRGSELVGADAKAVMSVSSAFHNAAEASASLLAHESAAGAGVAGLMSNVGRMLGHTSLLQGLVAVGVTFGVGAIWATRKAEEGAAHTALQEMQVDIGDKTNPYLQNVTKFTEKQKGRRFLAAGASSIGEAANMLFMGAPMGGAAGGMGMGGMGGVMALQMGLPMLGQTLVPENAVLNAYVNLRKAEHGELQIPPAERIAQVRQLVGAVPSVQPHGGYYNKLCEPIAAKIVEQKLSVRDTMQLLADNEKFTAFATEVKAAQPAHPATKGHEATKDAHGKVKEKDHEGAELARDTAEMHQDHADAHDAAKRERATDTSAADHALQHAHENAVHDNQPVAKTEKNGQLLEHVNEHAASDAHAHASAKPSMKISASEIEHEGTVDTLEKAVGQN